MHSQKNSLDIKRHKDKDSALSEAGKKLGAILAEFLETPTLLLLSGGSAFGILGHVDENLLDERLTIAMLDERFSHDKNINNFSLLQNTGFYQKALERDCNFIGTLPRKEDTLESLAQRFESSLKKWQKVNPRGKIAATLGMGPDGHTAGIMPFPEDKALFKKLFGMKNWIACYDAAGKNPHSRRITATLALLKAVNKSVGLIAGQEKRAALEKTASKSGRLNELPALIFWQMKNLEIHTDIN